jgi:hypothetical protein
VPHLPDLRGKGGMRVKKTERSGRKNAGAAPETVHATRTWTPFTARRDESRQVGREMQSNSVEAVVEGKVTARSHSDASSDVSHDPMLSSSCSSLAQTPRICSVQLRAPSLCIPGSLLVFK